MNKSWMYKAVFVIAIAVLISSLIGDWSPAVASTKTSVIPNNIKSLLNDYSIAISQGKQDKIDMFSQPMKDLIKDRRDYYSEYFDIGLHSKLLSIDSKFLFDDPSVSITQSDSQYQVAINETVDFLGRYHAPSIGDFPLIKASKWALKEATSDDERDEIKSRIKLIEKDVAHSSGPDGFTTTFLIHHEFLIADNGTTLQILQDDFTDKAQDIGEGVDNVRWENGKFVRSKPDHTKSPNFIIWNKKSVEELGQEYLETVRKTIDTRKNYYKAHNRVAPTTLSSNYIRSYAQWWGDNRTSDAGGGNCTYGGVTIWVDHINQSVWSGSFTKYCSDCANFVSQALWYGGIPTDSLWYADSTYWIQVVPLHQYMVWYYYADYASSIWDLDIGDFMETDDQGHTVLLMTYSPFTFSGHTNDRKRHTVTDMGFNTYFYHITY